MRQEFVFFLVLAAVLLATGSEVWAAAPANGPEQRCALGEKLGDCLVRGCEVFVGTVGKVGKSEKEKGEPDAKRAITLTPVEMKVDEWLSGGPADGKKGEVEVLHVTAPEITKTSVGPWRPWVQVPLKDLKAGTPLLIARWTRASNKPRWKGQTFDTALVVAGDEPTRQAREAILLHKKLHEAAAEDAEKEVAAAIKRIAAGPGKEILAGCLSVYLTRELAPKSQEDLDRGARGLASLMGTGRLSAESTQEAGQWLRRSFAMLSAPAREEVGKELVRVASGEDRGVALKVFPTLLLLTDVKVLDLKQVVGDDTTRQRLAERYREFLAGDKSRKPSSEFESQLGIKGTS